MRIQSCTTFFQVDIAFQSQVVILLFLALILLRICLILESISIQYNSVSTNDLLIRARDTL